MFVGSRSFCEGGAAAQRQETQEKEDIRQTKHPESLFQRELQL